MLQKKRKKKACQFKKCKNKNKCAVGIGLFIIFVGLISNLAIKKIYNITSLMHYGFIQHLKILYSFSQINSCKALRESERERRRERERARERSVKFLLDVAHSKLPQTAFYTKRTAATAKQINSFLHREDGGVESR